MGVFLVVCLLEMMIEEFFFFSRKIYRVLEC